MDRLLRLGQGGLGGLGKGAAATDAPVVDTQEQVYISSLALLKVIIHSVVFVMFLYMKALTIAVVRNVKSSLSLHELKLFYHLQVKV